MTKDKKIETLLSLANQAILSVHGLPEPEGHEIKQKLAVIIKLLEADKDPGTWDFSILTDGACLVKSLDGQTYSTKLEPVYRLYNQLLLHLG